ncbi:hypothetical protein [Streptosporangium sp. LJ11]|uniref:hypothetical protein n=1 Tax=Streptosporangium sp. LJ11 TaxID=3436927 RepID=UPI003F79213F
MHEQPIPYRTLDRAVAKAVDGKITQYLAGVPVLLDRYRTAPPAAKALIGTEVFVAVVAQLPDQSAGGATSPR